MWNALAQGMFKKQGVNLEFIKFTTGPAQTAALRSGVIDLAWGAAVTFYSIRSNGANVQWPATVGDFNGADGMVVGPNSPIKSVKDLKGKKIALPFYTVVHGPLMLLLKENDIAADSVELINLAPPQAAAAVLSGTADAAFAWPPFINEVVDRGGRLLLHAKDTPGGGWSWTGFATNQDWAKNNVNLLAAFYKVFDQGREGMNENRDLIIKTASSAVGMPEDAARREFDDLKFPALVDNVTADTPMSMCSTSGGKGIALTLNQARTFYTGTGQVKNPASYADYLDPAPLNQVFGTSCKV
jgi:ABC-type nitrate/sulfonate/bicarbonate transport system substrate-binding protein